MFTGLTERVGRLDRLTSGAAGVLARIGCGDLAPELRIGESVAVDGVCLTVVGTGRDWFEADLSLETLGRTSLGAKEPGSSLNLERALRISDRLGGHLVQGHVDGVGILVEVRPEGSGRRVRVTPPPSTRRYLIEKGSVALDGVSLTVATLKGRDFEVALIPHTIEATTLGEWQAARRINLEVDLLAKYVEKLLSPYPIADSEGG